MAEISIHAVDSLIPNIALMKLSQFHKNKGDNVKLWDPLFDTPDVLYLSKIFDFSDDVDYLPDCEVIKGGTGYNFEQRLTEEQDHTFPDYSIFNCDYALGRITRGCPRNCPWCVVPKVDGTRVRKVYDLEEWYSGQSHIRFIDDNMLFLPDVFCETVEKIPDGVTAHFEASDIRLMTKDIAKSFAKVKRKKDDIFYFAWDDEKAEDYFDPGIDMLNEAGIKSRYIGCYVLVGYNTSYEYDLYRINRIWSRGVYPFVMPFNKSDPYQKMLARWCNNRFIFKSVKWEEYEPWVKYQNEREKEKCLMDTSSHR